MTTPNEELRARRIADAEAAMQACYMDHADNRLTTTLLHDMATAAVAVLARQEEGREAVVTPSALADALECFWNAALGEARNHDGATMANAAVMAEGMNAIARRLRELTHPAPPIAGEGDAEQVLILADMFEGGRNDCGYVNVQINAGRYRRELVAALRRLATPTPQAAGDGREAFEKWVAKRWGCSTERWADSGEYKYHNTRDWWQCWKESRATAGQQAAGVSEVELADLIGDMTGATESDALIAANAVLRRFTAAGAASKEAVAWQYRWKQEGSRAFTYNTFRHPINEMGMSPQDIDWWVYGVKPAAAGAAPEGWPARYACNGPEGTFWTDDAVLANRLLLHDTAIERDEWTVTDTQQPGAQEKA